MSPVHLRIPIHQRGQSQTGLGYLCMCTVTPFFYTIPSNHSHIHRSVPADKLSDHRADYNNRPFKSISVIPAIANTSGRLHCELVCNLFMQTHRETAFLQLQELSIHNITRTVRFHRVAFYSQLKCKVGNIVDKVTALCINFDIDDAPIVSHAHLPHQLTNLSPPLHFFVFPTIGESGFI
jgi:hypothetical protein